MKYWEKDGALFRGGDWPEAVYHAGKGWVRYAGDASRVVSEGTVIDGDDAATLQSEIDVLGRRSKAS